MRGLRRMAVVARLTFEVLLEDVVELDQSIYIVGTDRESDPRSVTTSFYNFRKIVSRQKLGLHTSRSPTAYCRVRGLVAQDLYVLMHIL
jgi:hypothetical protein